MHFDSNLENNVYALAFFAYDATPLRSIVFSEILCMQTVVQNRNRITFLKTCAFLQ